MNQELLARAVALNDALVVKWSHEQSTELDEIWAQLKQPFSHLYGGRFLGDSVGPGWWPILVEAFGKIDEIMKAAPEYKFKVVQIKEKFGGLRFYSNINLVNATDDEDDEDKEDPVRSSLYKQVRAVIVEAEDRASETCEDCGEPGTRRNNGWLKTQCDKHAELAKKR